MQIDQRYFVCDVTYEHQNLHFFVLEDETTTTTMLEMPHVTKQHIPESQNREKSCCRIHSARISGVCFCCLQNNKNEQHQCNAILCSLVSFQSEF
jgi:hypothetical protein